MEALPRKKRGKADRLAASVSGDTADKTASGDQSLIIYSSLTEPMIDSMLSKFEEDTGSKADCLAMGTGDALKRIETEAGAPQADLLWSGTLGTVCADSEWGVFYTAGTIRLRKDHAAPNDCRVQFKR